MIILYLEIIITITTTTTTTTTTMQETAPTNTIIVITVIKNTKFVPLSVAFPLSFTRIYSGTD